MEEVIERYGDLTLVEGEYGIRMLYVPEGAGIPLQAWIDSHSAGAAALVRVSPVGSPTGWITAEEFSGVRGEDVQTVCFTVPDAAWHPCTTLPSYAEMVNPHGDQIPAPVVHTGDTYVPLHVHSEFSPLDGLSKIQELGDIVVEMGCPAVAITDHGYCAGHAELQKICDELGIKPIFGIEANFTDNRHRRGQWWVVPKDIEDPWSRYEGIRTGVGDPNTLGPFDNKKAAEREIADKGIDKTWVPWSDAKNVQADYRHLVLWAMDDEGLHNLWAASTEAHSTGFYGRPRMDWEVLETYGKGIMASTACLRGPLATAIEADDDIKARTVLARLMRIFNDRLYVEVHTNGLERQKHVNERSIAYAREYGIPLVAVTDSHYPRKEDQYHHDVWIASQTNKEITDDSDLFEGDCDYHMHTLEEVKASLAYLPSDVVDEAIANTLVVADRCTARIQGASTTPIFSREGGMQRDNERVVEIAMENWHKTLRGKKSQQVYMDRFEREMRLLIDKGFNGYFLMVWDYVMYAKRNGILVGPGRGSGGGCLVAYLMGITEIDPVEADLIFERFLTEGRTALPDFDIDFPTSKAPIIVEYVQKRWGEDHVARVGSHIRLKNKGVINALFRTFKETMPQLDWGDLTWWSKFVDEAEASSAGLGVKWDDLWAEHAEVLDPLREKYPILFDHADRMVGRLSTYGKHAAGYIISPEGSLSGRLPMRRAKEDEPLVTEFAMDVLEEVLGLIKFDLLNIKTLDIIQECMDLVKEHTGEQIDVYAWGEEEFSDPEIWDEIAAGHTLGMFQVETPAGTQLAKRLKPRNLSELADTITLVRPGPKRSGLTDMYLRRRFGEEPVSYVDDRLKEVLEPTLGVITYQEQIMATCMILAGYDSTRADKVRKILGKKKVEQVEAEGVVFIQGCVDNGMPREAATDLWEQMAEFARYSFNKAHAWGYALIGAWAKRFMVRYRTYMLTGALTVMSREDKNRVPEFITEARRVQRKVLPPDINASGFGFKIADDGAIRYGFDSIKGIGEAAVTDIISGQPYTSWEDFEQRRGSLVPPGQTKVKSDVVRLLAAVGAFDTIHPHRRYLETVLERAAVGDDTRCVFKRDEALGPNGLPCVFDWDSEPPPEPRYGKRGQLLKEKPRTIPKKCTIRCRNYTPPEPISPDDVPHYTEDEIRERENELLGVYLSSTPFDRIPEGDLEQCLDAEALDNAPPGSHLIAGIVSKVKGHVDRNGNTMAFLGVVAQTAEIDVTVFASTWERYSKDLKPGTLMFAFVSKNDRGYLLDTAMPL